MKISTKCPNCSKAFKVEEQFVRRKARCPACQSPFVVTLVQEMPQANPEPSKRVDADIEPARTIASGTIGMRQLVIAGIGGFVGAVFVTLSVVYMVSSSGKHPPVTVQPQQPVDKAVNEPPRIVSIDPKEQPTVVAPDVRTIEPPARNSNVFKTIPEPERTRKPSKAPEAVKIVDDRTKEQIENAKKNDEDKAYLRQLLHDPRYGTLNRRIASEIGEGIAAGKLGIGIGTLNNVAKAANLDEEQVITLFEQAVREGRSLGLARSLALNSTTDAVAFLRALQIQAADKKEKRLPCP